MSVCCCDGNKTRYDKEFSLHALSSKSKNAVLCSLHGEMERETTYENGNCQMENDEEFSSFRMFFFSFLNASGGEIEIKLQQHKRGE